MNELREALQTLVDAVAGLCMGEDWNDGTHAKTHGYKRKVREALPAAQSALAALSAEPAQEMTDAPAHVHKFRKIGGGKHYEQANLSAYGIGDRRDAPDPEEGFEWYGSTPLYYAASRASRLPEMTEADWPGLPPAPFYVNHSPLFTAAQYRAAQVAAVEAYKAKIRGGKT